MPTVHLLGAGAVVSDPHRTTTMIALDNGRGPLLVDCGGDPVPRLAAVGLDPLALAGLIVTHEHADHVAGVPLAMERLWLLGRRTPLPVHGIPAALAQVARSHDAFDVSGFEDYAGWTPRPFACEEGALVLEAHGWRVTAAPGVHAVPSVGLRFHDLASGATIVLSGDTAPAPAIVRLAAGCDLLLHEATGAGPVHSDAVQAAEAARDAGAARLVLVHLPPADVLAERLPSARAVRPDLEVGEELARYRI
jgi:ribonuclease Z